MSRENFRFELLVTDDRTHARRGVFQTPHGSVQTPAFMAVGTQATVKGITIAQLQSTGVEMILGNTYHLALRPGAEIVAQLGGLHRFMGWNGPILTDSGGFQLFSLAAQTRVKEEGATFRSHHDGKLLHLTPERAMEIQAQLGSDVAMALDHVIALPAKHEKIVDAMERTIRWAQRCQAAIQRSDQALFAIVQGGLDPELRVSCARQLAELDLPGYAVGGLSVGETPEEMYRCLEATCPALPADRPRYLMGVGRPQDLLEAVRLGIDLFDCVMPTRNGRNALAFTDQGPIKIRRREFLTDPRPLDETCPCGACRHSRAYLRHLFMVEEMLGPILLSWHNLMYYQRLMRDARAAIAEGRFAEFHAEKKRGWGLETAGAADLPEQTDLN